MFGNSGMKIQNENIEFKPRSIYGISKVFAYQAVINYREVYNLFLSNGISSNHESPRRGDHKKAKKILKWKPKFSINQLIGDMIQTNI